VTSAIRFRRKSRRWLVLEMLLENHGRPVKRDTMVRSISSRTHWFGSGKYKRYRVTQAVLQLRRLGFEIISKGRGEALTYQLIGGEPGEKL
jgi:DNA-binding winged helix-turn-helix (wHTH) protein